MTRQLKSLRELLLSPIPSVLDPSRQATQSVIRHP
jgi:hypothetical protein